ncbi:MAG: hypothetical protein AAFV46_00150 [Cyanobacteria bacterium J06635_11]
MIAIEDLLHEMLEFGQVLISEGTDYKWHVQFAFNCIRWQRVEATSDSLEYALKKVIGSATRAAQESVSDKKESIQEGQNIFTELNTLYNRLNL